MFSNTRTNMVKIVDPTSSVPKYVQIQAWLEDLIRTGRFKEGEKLPPETELSRQCEVNRATMRQAVLELVAKGMLRREKGMGTFVASTRPVKHKINRISSFRDDLDEIGVRESTEVLKKGTEKAPRHVAKNLILNTRSKVIVVHRLRTGNKIPLVYEESYLPYQMFKGILTMRLTGSMYTIFSKRFNIVLARCRQSIQAVNLNRKIAELFELPPKSAGLYMESVTYDDNNIPIEVLCSYYRGDRYVFEVELGKYQIKKRKNKFIKR